MDDIHELLDKQKRTFVTFQRSVCLQRLLDQGSTGEPLQTTTHRIQEGQPIGNFWGYKSIDIDENGHWIIEGADGSPKPISQLQPTDKQIIGNGLPKHYLNWNNTLNWKNFDFNMTMRGAFGFDILNMPRLQYESPVMLSRGTC